MIKFEKIRDLVGRSNATIIEVGAHDGTDTQAFLDAFPHCTVIAFEPEERAIRKFRERIHSDRVRLVESAVGSLSGQSVFFPSSGNMPNNNETWAQNWDYSGSIKQPDRHLTVYPWVKYADPVKVPIVRLDDWTTEHKLRGVDFIWADVQGAEGDLITGALQTLKQTRFFYTEYSNQNLYKDQSNLAAITALIPDFEIIEVYQDDVLLRNKLL